LFVSKETQHRTRTTLGRGKKKKSSSKQVNRKDEVICKLILPTYYSIECLVILSTTVFALDPLRTKIDLFANENIDDNTTN